MHLLITACPAIALQLSAYPRPFAKTTKDWELNSTVMHTIFGPDVAEVTVDLRWGDRFGQHCRVSGYAVRTHASL
jgi:hypothetical protein